MSYLVVMGVLSSYPIWMFHLDLYPKPICEVRVELPIRMEPIASLDHCLGITSFQHLSLQNLHSWEIIVNHIEVFVLLLGNDLLIN